MNKNLCVAPWTSIYIEPGGNVDYCCVGLNKLGNIGEKPIVDILQGEKSLGIKQGMIDDQPLPPGCTVCKIDPNSKEKSTSMKELLNEWIKVDHELYTKKENLTTKYLDLRWRNTCNSACVYCGPELSSLWAKELGIQQPINFDNIERIKKYIEPQLEHVDRVYLAGGEPLLMKENEWLLKELLKCNPDVNIVVNTNLSKIDTEVFELLKKFKNKRLGLSFESVGSQYEYIRYPSSWDQFEKNLDEVQRLGISFWIQSVYSVLSIDSFGKFLEWFDTKFALEDYAKRSTRISIHYVNSGQGGWMDPRALNNRKVLDRALENVASWKQRFPFASDRLSGIESFLNQPYVYSGPQDTNNFFLNIEQIDRRRGLDSRQLFPELYTD